MTLSLKSADASFRAEDVKDKSLKLIKNHVTGATNTPMNEKIKKTAEKHAACNLLL